MNIVNNVGLKRGLKRPDLALKRLAEDDTVFAIYYQQPINIAIDAENQVSTTLEGRFVIVPLADFIKNYKRKDLEALYQNILYSVCKVWLCRMNSVRIRIHKKEENT